MKKVFATLSLITLFSIISCSNHKDEHAVKKDRQSHWTYKGETSPEHWAEIEKNSDCNGKRQSPVNIIEINTLPTKQTTNPLNILYSPKTELNKVENNGHSIQFNFEKGDSLQYHGDTFHLAQIHFHEPSEHTINGIRYPLEIHLVHVNKNKEYTVMGVLAQEGQKSQLFEFLESFLPLKEGESKEIHQSLDLSTLFPKNNEFYSYGGSLTTPPCTENVNWIIFKEPIIVSVEEVIKLKNNMPKDNYRNEQPLNNRLVSINIHE